MSHTMDRRDFLRKVVAISASATILQSLAACGRPDAPAPEATATDVPASPTIPPATAAQTAASPTQTAAPAVATPAAAPSVAPSATPAPADIVAAHGPGASPTELTRRAIAALGGMGLFVHDGDDVIVKPNICNAYNGPEYASTTNPEVVAALVTLALEAGAKRVRVMDAPFSGTAQAAYAKSGIADAVNAAGGTMELMNRLRYREAPIPGGRKIQKWKVYGDILDADAVINVPIAKTHGSTRLTLGLKNLMGTVEDRNSFHSLGLDACIADLATIVRPALTVIDAIRVLTANGPTGGNLDDVRRADTIIASADPVAADAYATGLFDMQPGDITYISLAAEMGLGRMDLTAMRIAELSL